MMGIVLVIGPPASGKYTIGKMLSEKYNFNFLHEHQVKDLVDIYNLKNHQFAKIEQFKQTLFLLNRYFSFNKDKSIVLTLVICFNNPIYTLFIKKICTLYNVLMIELVVDLDIRLQRNVDTNRLLLKESKRDIEKSTNKIFELENNERLFSNSFDEFNSFENVLHCKFDNNHNPEKCLAEISKWLENNEVKF